MATSVELVQAIDEQDLKASKTPSMEVQAQDDFDFNKQAKASTELIQAQDELIQANSLFFHVQATDSSINKKSTDSKATRAVVSADAMSAMTANHPTTTATTDQKCNLLATTRPNNDTHLHAKATHITTNIWPRHNFGKHLKKKVSVSFLHGVELRTLPEEHFLAGETGLFAAKQFSQFDIVGEYVGMVKGPDFTGGEYSAELMTMTVDAQEYGNETRAINHFTSIAQNPNVKMIPCHIDGLPRIILVCKTDIAVGEEFLLNYGDEYVQRYLKGSSKTEDSGGE
jgi:hypothetical protein